MIAEHKDEWGPALAELMKQDGYDSEKALGALGEVIKAELQQSIFDTNSPPNAPATIKAKGGASKPLVHTGHMAQSVEAEVTRKGGGEE
jgi:hypothetical protein